MHDIEIKNMVRMALDAKDRAYAPYSKYNVGACVKGSSGAYYLGCNVENASFGLTLCAERCAVSKGISECEHKFTAIAIAAVGENYPIPCGACRQVLCEFCDASMEVIVANEKGAYVIYKFGDLFPMGFVFGRADGANG